MLRYLDCGLFENGFARIRCLDCAEEYLLAFSCKTRELCPSCAAKRSAATAALSAEEVIEEVGHAQWVFVIPKMLRPYFLHHRELLGGLARAAWETVLELMVAAVGDADFRPGMVAVVQTAGDLANWHPHVHALVSRGGWTQETRRRIGFTGRQNQEVSRTGCLAPTLFAANKVACLASPSIAMRKSNDKRVIVEPEYQQAMERLARYIMRPPISLERMAWDRVGEVCYRRKRGHESAGMTNARLRRSIRRSSWCG